MKLIPNNTSNIESNTQFWCGGWHSWYYVKYYYIFNANSKHPAQLAFIPFHIQSKWKIKVCLLILFVSLRISKHLCDGIMYTICLMLCDVCNLAFAIRYDTWISVWSSMNVAIPKDFQFTSGECVGIKAARDRK